jgi:hypothetical protein
MYFLEAPMRSEELLNPREAAREMRLTKGQTAAALIKSTEVMIVRV